MERWDGPTDCPNSSTWLCTLLTRRARDSGTGTRRAVAKNDAMKRLAAIPMIAVVCALVGGAMPASLHAEVDLERLKRLNDEALESSRQGHFAEAIPKAREVLRIVEQALGPAHPAVATSLNNLAMLLQATGDYAGARPLFERALQIQERALGPADPAVAQSLSNLALLLWKMGDYAGARPLSERALRIREQALGPTHPAVAQSLNNLAVLLENTGDYTGARTLNERALRILEQTLGPADPAVATSLSNLAVLLRDTGDYVGARPLYERALRILEQALGPAHPAVATTLNNLALLLKDTGDYARARPLYERALRINEQVLGPGHPDVAQILNNLALLLQATGDYAGARPLLEGALRIREQALGSGHPAVSTSLNNLAELLRETGDYAGARPLLERALRIKEQALGPGHPDVATGLSNLAAVHQATGDYASARPLFERALRIREQALGPGHPDVAQNLNSLAALLQTTGEYARSRALFERARLIDLAWARADVDLQDDAVRTVRRRTGRGLGRYAQLLAAITREPARDPAAVNPEAQAFLVAEQARAGPAQAALNRAGARAAARDAATATLARQVQELRDHLGAARKRVIIEYGRPPAQRDSSRLATAQQDVARLESDLQQAAQQLRAAFPQYAELAAPDPIDVAGAQALLKPDEALVSYFTVEDRLLLWVLRPGRPMVYRDQAIQGAELTALVRRVRGSLDQSANTDLAAGRLAPFDVAGAADLYQRLLGPVAGELAGVRHLIVVPDEVLLPLPFGVLVTRAEGEAYQRLAEVYAQGRAATPEELELYAKLSWLAREYAVTVLPSATSLRALRQIARARGTEVEPFVGFGDPVFEGGGRERGGAMLAARGTGVNLADLRRLNRLPGTRQELLAVARALGAEPATALYLDVRATKPQVLALDATGRLGRARVLAFATHGLLGGEVQGLRQPALVLTPPARVTAEDDGLLALDDVVGLKLTGTDWVILSACNTGAADGSGEGLSGFVRGFFFAGAPTLLVSHWSVEDRATQVLMTKVFAEYTKNPTTPRAELLRQGMLGLMDDAAGPTAYMAHPFAWAAFFLVGEGSR
jgi:CHAT domain-containing protein/Tfp pilus assembly protein PilF